MLLFKYIQVQSGLNPMKKPAREEKSITKQQILRKIEKSKISSIEQYKIIVQNLQNQNERLMRDRDEMKIRVDLLVERERQLISQQRGQESKNPLIDYTRLKAQLQKKHKQLQNEKKRIYNSINKGTLTVQVKEYLNKCALVQNQIDKNKKMLHDEKKTQKKLQKSVKAQLKKMDRDVPEREAIQQQNKQLRSMIWNLRIVDDLTNHVDVRLHNSIVRMENKKKIIEKLKTMTIEQIRREEAKTKIQLVEQNMRLKKGKSLGRPRLNTQSRVSTITTIDNKLSFRDNLIREIFDRQKILMQREEKQKQERQRKEKLEQQLEKLQLEKIEKEAELRALKIEQNRFKQLILKQQQRLGSGNKPQFSDANLQVNFFEDENPLPIQIVGNQTPLLQNDRIVLKTSKDTFITGLIVYENKISLACVRALYSNGKQTSCIVPEKYLAQKCKNRKVVLADPKDYLKWFKAYYDKTQSKLIRLQIYSNNKIKFQIGKQKELMLRNVMAYKFDNNSNQIPVCLRVSYRCEDGDWIMASVGVQLNAK